MAQLLFFFIIILNHPSSYEEGLERDQNVIGSFNVWI